MTTQDLTKIVKKTLKQHDGWLRMNPGTSQEIAEHLFPTEDMSSESDRDLVLTITALMWDNGFTPSSWGRGNSRWYWKEKPALKVTQNLAAVSR